MDDGRDTGVMDAVDMEAAAAEASASSSRASTELDTEVADLPPDTGPRAPRDTLAIPMGQGADEGPRTTAMDAVDLAALGLETSSDSLPAVKAEDYADAPPEKSDGGKPKKKRSKKRS
jgi:hypothetical protein